MSCRGNPNEDDDFHVLFESLIQPAKDLEKNWNVDLACYLQQYLYKFVCKRTAHFNFAQAAMLIQGSTYIYSKKVQLLYNLTLEYYNHLISTDTNRVNSQQNVPQRNKNQGSSTVPRLEDKFLSLDDMPVSDNISRRPRGQHGASSCLRMPAPPFLRIEDDSRDRGPVLVNMKGDKIGFYSQANLNRLQLGVSGDLNFFRLEESMSNGCSVSEHWPKLPDVDLSLERNCSPDHHNIDHHSFDVLPPYDEPLSPALLIHVDPPQSTEKIAKNVLTRNDSSETLPIMADLFPNVASPSEAANLTEKPVKQERTQWSPSNKLKRAGLKRKSLEESKDDLEIKREASSQEHRHRSTW